MFTFAFCVTTTEVEEFLTTSGGRARYVHKIAANAALDELAKWDKHLIVFSFDGSGGNFLDFAAACLH
ncbi:hypothetical protein IJG90_03770 [Candidatus Saccharibacteria bacterium]|nr:hypothetical protein [Candidatus Saccharibacteria bacterium]